MRLSINVIVQILGVLAQATNQIMDLVPEEYRMTVAAGIGVVQAVVAFLAHFSNPDGTSASTSYVAPVRTNKVILPILVLLLALAFAPSVLAAEPETVAGAGMSWNQYASPQINGNLLFAKRLGEGTYSFNFVDIISKSIEPFSVSTSVTTGIGKKITYIYKAPVFVTAGVGILTGDQEVGYAWQSGGTVVINLGKGWLLMPNVRVIKSSLTDFQWIGGVLFGLAR